MERNGYNRMSEEGYEREVYVDDQCCQNCRYWCDWDPMERYNGCKNYGREDYERKPKSRWCVDWKGLSGMDGMSTSVGGMSTGLRGKRGGRR